MSSSTHAPSGFLIPSTAQPGPSSNIAASFPSHRSITDPSNSNDGSVARRLASDMLHNNYGRTVQQRNETCLSDKDNVDLQYKDEWAIGTPDSVEDDKGSHRRSVLVRPPKGRMLKI